MCSRRKRLCDSIAADRTLPASGSTADFQWLRTGAPHDYVRPMNVGALILQGGRRVLFSVNDCFPALINAHDVCCFIGDVIHTLKTAFADGGVHTGLAEGNQSQDTGG